MRDEILTRLLKQGSEYSSGEVVSGCLGVTRAAIWKCIRQLKEEGFVIEAVPHKGYRLTGWPDRLNGVVLDSLLNTQFLGRALDIHEEIDSTNLRARELAVQEAPHGMLVTAEMQHMGRGRLGRRWISPRGTGLWMSLILRPDMAPEEAHRITVLTALAVSKAISRHTGLQAGIKWPNDILIGSRKICGILTEIQAEPDLIHYVIVGIGVNVNNEAGSFPPDLAETAGSIKMATGHHTDRMVLAAEILNNLEHLYEDCRNNHFHSILDAYRQASVTLGRSVRVIGRTETFDGIAEELLEDGTLMIRLPDGSRQHVLSGDVSIRGI